MKVSINQDDCIECGACEEACSEVFILESSEKASIIEKYQTEGPLLKERLTMIWATACRKLLMDVL